MGTTTSRSLPPRPPVAPGRVRVCFSGFTLSHHTNRARKLADEIVQSQPLGSYETWFYFDAAKKYRTFINEAIKPKLSSDQQEEFGPHKSSPFCWLEYDDGSVVALGGRDRLCEWAEEKFPDTETIRKLATTQPGLSEAWVDESPGTAPKE